MEHWLLRLTGCPTIVNAPVGLGFVFTSPRPLARFLRPFVRLGLKLLLNPPGSRVIFENPDDREEFVTARIVRREDAALIPGAGVDVRRFRQHPDPPPPLVFVLAARMLTSKGVREFVKAAEVLKREGENARFVLAGAPDPSNPDSITEHELLGWTATDLVEWIGHQSDMAAVYANAHVACLPSYREGLPKSLLEAMSAGLPVVSTDVVGCRSVVRHGETGLLVPAQDAVALAQAFRLMIRDSAMRLRMGAAGRQRAVSEFASELITAATLEVYCGVPTSDNHVGLATDVKNRDVRR